jgi:DNA-directed RNA polymerase specialized sigma24 family protein
VARSAGPAAFTEFARRIEPRLRYALAGRLDADLVRDATQEALVYAWNHWDKIERLDNPDGYLYTLAKRWGWKQAKRASSLPEVGVTDPLPGEPGLPRALGQLSPMQRQTVYLVEGLGMTQQETADLLGVSRSTVQTHLERALSHLRQELGVTIDE